MLLLHLHLHLPLLHLLQHLLRRFYLRLIGIGLIGIWLLGGFRRRLLVDIIVVIDHVIAIVRHGWVINIRWNVVLGRNHTRACLSHAHPRLRLRLRWCGLMRNCSAFGFCHENHARERSVVAGGAEQDIVKTRSVE